MDKRIHQQSDVILGGFHCCTRSTRDFVIDKRIDPMKKKLSSKAGFLHRNWANQEVCCKEWGAAGKKHLKDANYRRLKVVVDCGG